jgi:hypothetical protein
MRARGNVVASMRPIACLVALALLSPAGGARAQAGIRVVEIERVRVDGALGDWRGAQFADLGEGADASMRFAIGHDARGFFVAAQVRDDRLVRTERRGATEDAVIFTVAPAGRNRAVDVFLFAGETGRSAASIGIATAGADRISAVRGAEVVEGPLARGSGYVIEAFVPFSAIAGSERWEQARGSIRLRDVDREARPEVESEPALAPLDGLVPFIASGGTSGALEEFLAARGLPGARPSRDLRGDVAEDERPERVVVVDRYVVVMGPGYRGGQGFSYHQLAIDEAAGVRAAELVELTGDGKAELAVTLRQSNAQGSRDVWQVIALSGETPRPIFGIEVRKATDDGAIEASVRVQRARGGAPQIEHRAGRAQGLDASNYNERPASDFEPILVPWGPIASRTYRWDGRSFAREGERPNPRYRPPEVQPARETSDAEPAPALAPSEEDLLAAFRRERSIARNARPRFRARVNLAGTNEPETALVFGRQLVIVGPGVQGGTGFFYYEIPAPSDADLISMETADVTGDRRAELLFRVRQSFGEVQREVLLVHALSGEGFPRLLQVEVERTQENSAIENEVRTERGTLEIRPGRARGWSAEHWPFTVDPNDSVAPLLLPWRDRAVRYTYRNGRLVH